MCSNVSVALKVFTCNHWQGLTFFEVVVMNDSWGQFQLAQSKQRIKTFILRIENGPLIFHEDFSIHESNSNSLVASIHSNSNSNHKPLSCVSWLQQNRELATTKHFCLSLNTYFLYSILFNIKPESVVK